MYEIDFARKLDDKTGGVAIEGEVTFTHAPKHVVSPKNSQKSYDFWSQFIVIKDSTNSMGVNIAFGEEEDKKKNGDKIQVKGTVHKYFAENKETGEKEEKIVLKNAKIIESEEEKAKKELKKNEIKKDTEKAKPQIINNSISKISSEWETRKEAVKIAFDYGLKENFSIHDCLDLAKTIGTYIKSGEVNIVTINTEKKLVEKEPEKITEREEEKPKIKKEETKQVKTNKDLEKLFHNGQEIGLSTWVELIGFAVKKDIFSVGISVEDARSKLLANDKDCYDSLIDFIDIKEDVSSLPDDEQPTGEIPF